MNLLLEIYNKIILNESVSSNSVTDSIKNKYRVTINYEGDPSHGVAPGLRTIEVYAYGLTKAGNPVIRAYQPYGDTVSTVPNWKFFRLDRIKTWKPTYALVTQPAPGFNPNGDKSMSEVYTVADFNQTTDISNATGPKQSPKKVGQLDNIEKILADREKEKKRGKEYSKIINRPSAPIQKPTPKEPNINGSEENKSQEISEPEVLGVNQEPETIGPKETPESPKTPNEINNGNTFKTKGEEELDKVKDLNRRLDNARKIDLSTIPRR